MATTPLSNYNLSAKMGGPLGHTFDLFTQTNYPYQLGSVVCGWTSTLSGIDETNPRFYAAMRVCKDGTRFMTVPLLIGDLHRLLRSCSALVYDEKTSLPNRVALLSTSMLDTTQHTFEVAGWLAERQLYTVSQEVFDTFASIAHIAKAASATVGLVTNITYLATSSSNPDATEQEQQIETKQKAFSWCNLLMNIANIVLGILGVLGVMVGLVVAAPITLTLAAIATATAITGFFFMKQREDLVYEQSLKEIATKA